MQKMAGLKKLFLGHQGILKMGRWFCLALVRAKYFLEGKNLPLHWKDIKSSALSVPLNLM